jgi:hypothetical protein
MCGFKAFSFRKLLATLIWVLTSVSAVAQPGGGPGGEPGGGGDPGGGGGIQAGGPINVLPQPNLAIGEQVTLSVPYVSGATYFWQARCVNQDPEMWRHEVGWDNPTITDCIGVSGAEEYRCTMTLQNGQQLRSSTTVTFNPPSHETVHGLGISHGGPPVFYIDLEFRQYWQDENGILRELGPCCSAFVQEQIVHIGADGNVEHDSGWIPVSPPNDGQLFFHSPNIVDRKVINVVGWDQIPDGAVVKRTDQRLRIQVYECGSPDPYWMVSPWYRFEWRKLDYNTLVYQTRIF